MENYQKGGYIDIGWGALQKAIPNPNLGQTHGVQPLNEYDQYFHPGMDQGLNRSANQSAAGQIWNGVRSRGLSVIPKALAGIGYVGGAMQALAEQDMEAIWTNPLAVAMNNADDALKELYPVYKSRQYAESGLFGKMLTTSMWADDFLDGAAFMASAYIPGSGIGKALGVGKAVNTASGLAKGFKALGVADETIQAVADFSKLATTNVYNTVAESGAEAYQTQKEVDGILEALHPEMSREERKRLSSEAASRTFGWNMAALLLPNMVETTMFHGAGKGSRQALRDAVWAKNGEALAQTTSLLKKAGLGLLSEGLFEENIQGAIQQYERMYAEDPTNTPSQLESIASTMWSGVKGFGKSFLGMDTTEIEKDQAMAIALGGILGGGMGTFSAIRENNMSKSLATEEKNRYKDFFSEIAPTAVRQFIDNTGAIYKKDGTYKTKVTNEDGTEKEITVPNYAVKTNDDGSLELIKDSDKMLNMTLNTLRNKSMSTLSMLAAIKEDNTMDEYHKEMALSMFAHDLFSKGYSAEEAKQYLDKVGDIGTKEAEQLGIKTYIKDNFNVVRSKIEDLEKLHSKHYGTKSSPEDLNFNKVMFKSEYLLKSRLASLNRIRNTVTSEKAKQGIDDMIEDSTKYVDEINNNRSEFRKEFDIATNDISNKRLEHNKLNAKANRTTEENNRLDELTYEISEHYNVRGQYSAFQTAYSTSASLSPYESSLVEPGLEGTKEILNGKAYMMSERVRDGLDAGENAIGLVNSFTQNTLGTPDDLVTAKRLDNDLRVELDKAYGVVDLQRGVDRAREMLFEKSQIFNDEFNDNPDQDLDGLERQILKDLLNEAQTEVPEVKEALRNAIADENNNIVPVDFLNLERETRQLDEYEQSLIPMMDKARDTVNKIGEARPSLDAYLRGDNRTKNLISRFDSVTKDKFGLEKMFLSESTLNKFDGLLRKFKDSPESIFDIDGAKKLLKDLKTRKRVFTSRGEDIDKLNEFIEFVENILIPQINLNLQSWENKQIRATNEKVLGMLSSLGLTSIENTVPDSEKQTVASLSIKTSVATRTVLEEVLGKDNVQVMLETIDSDRDNIFNYDALVIGLQKFATKATDDQKKVFKDSIESYRDGLLLKLGETANSIPGQGMLRDGIFKNEKDYLGQPVGYLETILASKFTKEWEDPNSRISQYIIDRDIVALYQDVDTKFKNLSEAERELLKKILFLHRQVVAADNLVRLDYSSRILDKKLSTYFEKDSFTPSPQQNIVLTELLGSILGDTRDRVYGNWNLVDGLPGSGKTFAVASMLPTLLEKIWGKPKSEFVRAFSANNTTSENINKAISGANTTVESFMKDSLDNVRLVIIDEIYTFTSDQIDFIQKRIDEHNKKVAKDKQIRVVALGDPSQRASSKLYRMSDSTSGIFRVDTLTASYRTNVGAISGFLEKFKLTTKEVVGEDVTSSQDFTKIADTNTIVGVSSSDNIDSIIDLVNLPSTRSRIIIVPNQALVTEIKNKKSLSSGKSIPSNVRVATIEEVQGLQWEEVYTYLPFNSLSSDTNLNKNRDLYTAFSRAKAYLHVVVPDFKNYVDPTIDATAKTNQDQIDANKDKTLERLKNAERLLATLDGVPTIVVPIIPKEVEETGDLPEDTSSVEEVQEDYDEVDAQEEPVAEPDLTVYEGSASLHYPTNYGIKNLAKGSILNVVRGDKNGKVIYYLLRSNLDTNEHELMGALGNEDFNGELGEYFKSIIKNVPAQFVSATEIEKKGTFTSVNATRAIVGGIKVESSSPLGNTKNNTWNEVDDVIEDSIKSFYNTYFGSTNGVRNYPADAFDSKGVYHPENDWVLSDGSVNWAVVSRHAEVFLMTDKRAGEIKDANVNLFSGHPYLVIKNPAQRNGVEAKDIYIHLQPKPLAKSSEYFNRVNPVYKAFVVLDGINKELSLDAVSRQDPKDESFEKMYRDYAKQNYEVDIVGGIKIKPKTQRMSIIDIVRESNTYLAEELSKLNPEQLAELHTNLDIIVESFFTPKHRARHFNSEEEVRSFMGDRLADIEVKKTGNTQYYVATKLNDNDKKEYEMEWILSSGYGKAQTALNDMARANASLTPENADKLNIRRYDTKNIKGQVTKVGMAHSLLSNQLYTDYHSDRAGFYDAVGNSMGLYATDFQGDGARKRLIEAASNATKPDGTYHMKGISAGERYRAAEELLNSFSIYPFSLSTLKALASDEAFEKGYHEYQGVSLRTPLDASTRTGTKDYKVPLVQQGINQKGSSLGDKEIRDVINKDIRTKYSGTRRTTLIVSPTVKEDSKPVILTTTEVLTQIANNSKLPFKELVEVLMSIDPKIRIVIDKSSKVSSYNPDTNLITFGGEFDKNSIRSVATMLHEIIHSVSDNTLYNALFSDKATTADLLYLQRVREFKNEFEEAVRKKGIEPGMLRQATVEVVNANPLEAEYRDLVEFMASMSKPEMWAQLKKNKVSKKTISKLLSDLVNAIAEFLGLSVADVTTKDALLGSLKALYATVADPKSVTEVSIIGLKDKGLSYLKKNGFIDEDGNFTEKFNALTPEQQKARLDIASRKDEVKPQGESYGYQEPENFKLISAPGVIFTNFTVDASLTEAFPNSSKTALNILSSILTESSISIEPKSIKELIADPRLGEVLWNLVFTESDRIVLRNKYKGEVNVVASLVDPISELGTIVEEVREMLRSKAIDKVSDRITEESAELYDTARMMLLNHIYDAITVVDNQNISNTKVVKTSAQAADEFRKSLPARLAKKEEQLESAQLIYAEDNDADSEEEIFDLSNEINVIKALLGTNVRTNKPMFLELMNDIYPASHYSSLTEIEEEAASDLKKAKMGANISEHEKRYNKQETISSAIKDVLVTIKLEDGRFVNSATAYIKLLQYIEDFGFDADTRETAINHLLASIKKELALDVSGTSKVVLRKLQSIIQLATDEISVNTGQKLDLTKAVISKIDSNNHVKYAVVTSSRNVIGIVNGEQTSEDKTSTWESDLTKLQAKSGMTVAEFNEYYLKHQAENQLRELKATMGSSIENNLMIGERSNAKGLDIKYKTAIASGINFSLKEEMKLSLEAFHHNNELKYLKDTFVRVFPYSADIIFGTKQSGKTIELTEKNKVQAIKDFLSIVGFRHYADRLSIPSGVDDIMAKIKFILDKATGLEEFKEVSEESDEELKGLTFEKFVDEYDHAIGKITNIIEKSNDFLRNPSVRTLIGEKYYKFHESTYAKDVINRLVEGKANKIFNGTKGSRVDIAFHEHLKADLYGETNIFSSGLSKIYDQREHEGLMNTDIGAPTMLSRENKMYYFHREILQGFMDGIRQSGGRSFYLFSAPPSDKPKHPMYEISYLNEVDISKSIDKTLQHFLNRKGITLPIKNFNKSIQNNPYRNFEVLGKALEVLGLELTEENLPVIKVEVLRQLDLITLDMIKQLEEVQMGLPADYYYRMAEILNKVETPSKDVILDGKVIWSKELYDKMVAKTKKDTGGDMLEKDRVEKVYKKNLEDANFRHQLLYPLIQSYIHNHYLGSFHVTQLFSGDLMAYKDTEDIVKRFAGMYAPGFRGLVDAKVGMKPTYKSMMVADTQVQGKDTIGRLKAVIFGDRATIVDGKNQLTKEEEEEFAVFASNFDKVDIADGQGFMLPSRQTQIMKGFGRTWGAGNIMKPVHYEVRTHTAVRPDGTTYTTGIPIYTKYSSIVLTDDLAQRFTFIKKLREKMVEHGVDELIMDSAIKLGVPLVSDKDGVSVKFDMDAFLSSTKDSISEYQVSPVLELSNENFRLQLNPASEIEKEVPIYSQLMYFLNISEATDVEASDAYEAVAELIRMGVEEFKENITPAKLKSFLMSKFTGPGAERSMDLLIKGISVNNPLVQKKAIVAIATELQNRAISIKFGNGGKWVLMSSIGIKKYEDIEMFNGKKINDSSVELGYRREAVTKDGVTKYIVSAEVIVPEESLSKSQLDAISRGETLFLYNEALAYRIPSTELHSAVAIKVVGVHRMNTNMIIAPVDLMAIQGSDQP